jgi:hypothetical protein
VQFLRASRTGFAANDVHVATPQAGAPARRRRKRPTSPNDPQEGASVQAIAAAAVPRREKMPPAGVSAQNAGVSSVPAQRIKIQDA